jgi:histidine triad (HIT) family protein
MSDCLFCRIVAGEVPATLVAETDRTIAFRDISPQAPTHVLVVPREHHADLAACADADPGLLADVLARPSRWPGRRGWTAATACSPTPAPTPARPCHHLHLHVLGGRPLGALG